MKTLAGLIVVSLVGTHTSSKISLPDKVKEVICAQRLVTYGEFRNEYEYLEWAYKPDNFTTWQCILVGIQPRSSDCVEWMPKFRKCVENL
jgi:hypothetical protein